MVWGNSVHMKTLTLTLIPNMIQRGKTQCNWFQTLTVWGRQPVSLKLLCSLEQKRVFCQISDNEVGASFLGGKCACARVNPIPSETTQQHGFVLQHGSATWTPKSVIKWGNSVSKVVIMIGCSDKENVE